MTATWLVPIGPQEGLEQGQIRLPEEQQEEQESKQGADALSCAVPGAHSLVLSPHAIRLEGETAADVLASQLLVHVPSGPEAT